MSETGILKWYEKWYEKGLSLFAPLDYIEAVTRLENRFQSRSQNRWRLQAIVEGDSPSPLKKMVRKGTVPFRTKNHSAS